MTRKSALILCCTLLPIGPGCIAPANVGSATVEGPRKLFDRSWTQTKDTHLPAKTFSTAISGVESKSIVQGQPAGLERAPEPLAIKPVDVSTLPLLERPPEVLKEARKGSAGTVTIADAPETPEPKPAIYQILPSTPTLLENPGDDMEPAVRAFHLILKNNHQEAIKNLRGYDDSTQEFLLRILPLMAQIVRTSLDKMPAQERQNFHDMVKGMDQWLREHCELLVTKMAYCKRIHGFADIEPLPADHAFLAKTDNRPGDLVQLYVELKNFTSKHTKEGDYLTKLACSLELKDMQGQKVWSHTFDKNETTYRRSACLNDYHGNYSFYVPALPTGTYQLTIQIVDETIPVHRRVARKSLPFRVTPVANQTGPR